MIKIGDYVVLKNSSSTGLVTNISENNCTIYLNGKKIITTLDNIEKIDNDKVINKIKTNGDNKIKVKYNTENSKTNFVNEIMIRHQTVEEALFNLDNFIQEAIYNNIKTVRIIHGKHGGILRKAVHEYLKSNKNILDFRLGNYFEGSYGVTIANIKSK